MSPPSGEPPKGLQEFLSEAQEIVEGLNSDLLALDQAGRVGGLDPDLLNSVFRGAHSLKGLAGMFGLGGISELSHELEDLLDSLRLGKVELSPDLLDLLFEGIETFSRMFRDLEAKGVSSEEDPAIGEYVERLRRAAASEGPVDGPSTPELVGLDRAVLDVLTEYEEHRLKENLRAERNLFVVHAGFDLMTFDVGLSDLNSALKGEGEVISTLPSSTPGDENSIDFELLYGSKLSHGELERLVGGERVSVSPVPVRRDATAADPPRTTEEATRQHRIPTEVAEEELHAEPEAAPAKGAQAPTPRGVGQTVRVDIRKLDNLMLIVGELVLSQLALRRVYEEVRDSAGFRGPAIELFKEQRVLERRIRQLQDGIMAIRMVPLGPTFDKVSRIVRRICREAGKEVDLDVGGGETELDKMIVEDLSDPLVHLIRNSLDHGIEAGADRRAAGKPERGRIRLTAAQRGSHVVVEVADDGSGIDDEALRAAAVRRGLIDQARAEELSLNETLDLMFQPGLTTREEASEISGRGVGLDVVKANVAKLAGAIEVESAAGEGTRFRMTLPVTLAIVRAMLVSVAGRTFALPLTSIRESVAALPGSIETVGETEVFSYREAPLPLIRLVEHFRLSAAGLPAGHAARAALAWPEDSPEGYVVVVGLAERRLGLFVDDLIGEQDLVVKPLGSAFTSVRGFAGAAELADRRTVLVLDAGDLIDEVLAQGVARG